MFVKIILIAALYYPLSIGLTFYQKWLLKVSGYFNLLSIFVHRFSVET